MSFPKTGRDFQRLYEVSNLLEEIDATKQDMKYSAVLAQFDSCTGVNPIVQKLLYHLQQKWTHRASKFMSENSVVFSIL